MAYKSLITFDLPSATDKQREIFYESLIKKNWVKISSLTTAWEATFLEKVTRADAVTELESDLRIAKNESKAPKVEYAIQLDPVDLVIKTI
jgi:hypothetical protein